MIDFADQISTANAQAKGEQDLTHLEGLANSKKKMPAAEVRKAAQEFEQMVLDMVMKGMRRSIPKSDMADGGAAEETFTGMLDEQYLRTMSDQGGMGLADMITRQYVELGMIEEEKKPVLSGCEQQSPAAPSIPMPLAAANSNAALANNLNSLMPCDGKISSAYGTRKDPFTGADRFHHGLDIAAPEGSSVRCSSDGVVAFCGPKGGYGNVVVVDHGDGVQSMYAHNSALLVEKGDRVTRGQEVAKVGSTGRSTGAHLHFEVRKNGVAIDPRPYLKGTNIDIRDTHNHGDLQ